MVQKKFSRSGFSPLFAHPRLFSEAVSSLEAALLLISTKNCELWSGQVRSNDIPVLNGFVNRTNLRALRACTEWQEVRVLRTSGHFPAMQCSIFQRLQHATRYGTNCEGNIYVGYLFVRG